MTNEHSRWHPKISYRCFDVWFLVYFFGPFAGSSNKFNSFSCVWMPSSSGLLWIEVDLTGLCLQNGPTSLINEWTTVTPVEMAENKWVTELISYNPTYRSFVRAHLVGSRCVLKKGIVIVVANPMTWRWFFLTINLGVGFFPFKVAVTTRMTTYLVRGIPINMY